MPSLLDNYKGSYATIGDAKAAMNNGTFASANPYSSPPPSAPSAPTVSTSTPSFSAPMGMTAVQPLVNMPAPTVTKPQLPSIDVNGITQRITSDYQGQLAAQKQAIEQELAKIQQGNALAVTQNQNALQDELNKLGQQKTLNDQTAINLQNRRGGFYSGGLDYQLGNIARANTEATGQAQRDIAARNADLWSKNALAAAQAAQNIQLLQSQAPDKIRSLIQQEIDRQRGVNMQEAGLTGQYNGAPTLAAQQQQYNQMNQDRNFNLNVGQLTGFLEDPQSAAIRQQMQQNSAAWFNASSEQQKQLAAENQGLASLIGATQDENGNWQFPQTGTPTVAMRNQMLNEQQQTAVLTGFLPDGTPTNAYQQQQLQNEWKAADETGQITPLLSQIYGIPAGTPTYKARQDAMTNAMERARISISQQSANTAATNAQNSAKNANLSALYKQWENTGKAPEGIPGVDAGTPLYDKVGAREGDQAPKSTDYKSDASFAQDVADIYSNPTLAETTIDKNVNQFISKYGYDGYKALRTELDAAKKKLADQTAGG